MTLRAAVAENLQLHDDVDLEPAMFSAELSQKQFGEDLIDNDELNYGDPASALKLGEVRLQAGTESNEGISASGTPMLNHQSNNESA